MVFVLIIVAWIKFCSIKTDQRCELTLCLGPRGNRARAPEAEPGPPGAPRHSTCVRWRCVFQKQKSVRRISEQIYRQRRSSCNRVGGLKNCLTSCCMSIIYCVNNIQQGITRKGQTLNANVKHFCYGITLLSGTVKQSLEDDIQYILCHTVRPSVSTHILQQYYTMGDTMA
jgi:hypothetical protein